MAEIRLLLVTGSTRRLSTNSAALLTAQELLNGHATTVYDGLPDLPGGDLRQAGRVDQRRGARTRRRRGCCAPRGSSYVGARVVDSSGIRVPVSAHSVGPTGVVADPATRASLAEAIGKIVAELELFPREQG